MKKIQLKTRTTELLADTVTPVGIYLQVRDKYANSVLLESTDYHGNDNSSSFICCNPIADFCLSENELSITYPNNSTDNLQPKDIVSELNKFINRFEIEGKEEKGIGLYGYHCFDTAQYFDTTSFDKQVEIPLINYSLFEFVVIINQFNNTLRIVQTYSDGQENELDDFISILNKANHPKYDFSLVNDETTNFSNEEFCSNVEKGIEHCKQGDVFQIVLSRQFKQSFQGDEFNVYRALRAINPSPYLFYFDYGSFRLMGSSPEAQIIVKEGKATINPIAGTFRRTGDDEKDAELAKELSNDKKENAEHVMLVDLARNDLSKSADKVEVEVYKEVQYYSHVIHLVSKVTGQLSNKEQTLEMMANTFPAGTLSGAPKYKALELINKYENTSRGFYGGAIGTIGFDGSINQAIMIRSLMSKNNELTFQAGAGIVAQSQPDNELQEVENKLAAVRKAIIMATEL